MKPLPERLNERLEQRNARSSYGEEPSASALTRDPEADALVALALRVQSASPLRVDPAFARHLGQRILARNAALHLGQPVRGWSFPRLLRAHPVFRVALGLCLLLLLLGTGGRLVPAPAANPDTAVVVE